MNEREIAELRRRLKPEKSGISWLRGCYVGDKGEMLSEFDQSLGNLSPEESAAVLTVLKRTLSGKLGKNLVDVEFSTQQVLEGQEHKLLMELRSSQLKNEDAVHTLYQKIIGSVHFETSYLILLAMDHYDVPSFGKDGARQEDGAEVFSYFLCSVCPVRLTKPALRYDSPQRRFCSTSADLVVSPPQLGFLFPAFDDRSTNIYNALMYTHSPADNHERFVEAVFRAQAPMAADEQKENFRSLLSDTVAEDCSIELVRSVHDGLRGLMDEHKANRDQEPLVISRQTVAGMLGGCGVARERVEEFSHRFDRVFGENARISPGNLLDGGQYKLETPDVTIRVNPENSDLVQTRIIGGVKYILIRAEEGVSVNGVNISFGAE